MNNNARPRPLPLNCPPPLTKPIDRCNRGQYETGKGSFNTPDLPTVSFESISKVLAQPGNLMFFHAAFSSAVLVPMCVLLFDLNPNDPAQLALVQAGANARYTLGPSSPNGSGATVWYEATAEETKVSMADNPQGSKGLPFNFGIIAAASITPRVLTLGQGTLIMAVTARMQL